MKKAKTTSRLKPAKGKSWTDKVNDDSKSEQVKRLEKDFADMPANSMMLIATPKIIDGYIRSVPKGKAISLQTMRKDLALAYRAEYTCPVTTGIFLRIVAEAAHEQLTAGKVLKSVAPFWRVVEEKSPLNKKLSFGPDLVIQQRKKEGISKEPVKKE
ncbi:hypothetical protein SanaruYs_16270 [Chryseotalea sanaruensis]|uniref:Uncharacterized protein n=1 Tax=Chryseotalea sanaruensis TaxID=2482724 RepID=A0A401U935_9BACT|nr:hypothetical protein [Chryseotalea sanaruensis]GCC51402.1 hypothetical protein SanaruYs_16270 [Chryseotalea sanaruensis]